MVCLASGQAAELSLTLLVALACVVPSAGFGFTPTLPGRSGVLPGRRAAPKGAMSMQLFPVEGMGFKWPSFGGKQDPAYHRAREAYHLERVRYHQERARHHHQLAQGGSLPTKRTFDPADRTKILFVDLSNVCRAAAAEATLKHLAEKAGKGERFLVASCSTGGGTAEWYKPEVAKFIETDSADPRMTSHAIKRGVSLSGIRSKAMTREDVKAYDVIVCMDMQNKRDVLQAADYWGVRDEANAKLRSLTSYCRGTATTEVPDPYYGGKGATLSGQVFERVLDMLEDGCVGLMRDVEQGLL